MVPKSYLCCLLDEVLAQSMLCQTESGVTMSPGSFENCSHYRAEEAEYMELKGVVGKKLQKPYMTPVVKKSPSLGLKNRVILPY